ncbi:tripartite tricarboxylate transporter substrate binding protein [Ramlibacter henchirensis]|uniref:Tripartite tricarboxylate transporter substrate binding protein n=1 Tax=Ramlibacter henchirensis TaxID=204072 RepID=A0A4Z0BXR4_9BURK|nr:tripartite tricarboxylate transporter substrate binding protein [Ramlibacter henchirensis]TFZ02719.1 tripartite tricarboxylate transporter substrate binding protein [Ramlibacter henchirensis]
MDTRIYTRRQLLGHAAAGGALLGLGSRALAQSDYPKQPIRFILPYAPGGVTDLTMRTVSKEVEKKLGQTIVIDNRAGAGGAVGMTAVAKAPPDGYTIGATASSTIIATPMLNAVSYDGSDFAFISLLATVPMVLTVNASVPVRTAEEFLKYVKANAGKLNYGSTAIGHYGHVAMMEVSESTGSAMVHSPYKGESPLMQDLVGGQLQFAFFAPSTAKPMAESGKLRMLGVSGTKRIKSLPNVPTLAEQGWSAPIFKMNPGWVGVVAPAKTPQAIVQRLSAEYVAAMKVPEINDQIANYGMDPVGSTSEQFAATFQAEKPIWRQLLTKAGLEVKG